VAILREFERRLGGLVEGLFAKTFRSGLQPVELAKRVLKEMDAGRSVGVSEVWAPNAFVFRLSPSDAEHFQQAEAALVTDASAGSAPRPAYLGEVREALVARQHSSLTSADA